MHPRSHKCGDLRSTDVSKTVSLSGWVNGYRDHGGVVFIDLRDREGITQIVFHPEDAEAHKLSNRLRNEDVIWIEGKCLAREKGMANPKLATGDIEVSAQKLVILNKATTPPFTPDDADNVGEETRLRYRYIDLRRPRMQQILKTRHRVTKIIRDYFDLEGFYEIETPFLCKSTPEGARDFLVPSRLQPGAFYALPQSPQLFKQILMVAGYEKYLQIVRCFRDEDPRADRQAEFTQVDLEMSFIDQETIMTVVEGCVRRIWKEILGIEVPKIKRVTYAECMDRYGSDRPDLRFGMELINISDIAAKTDFGVFKSAIAAGGLVKAIVVPGGGAMTRKDTDALAEWSKLFGAKGLAVTKVIANNTLETGIAKFLAPVAAELIAKIGAKEGDLVCFAADNFKVVHRVLGELRIKLAKERGMLKDGDWQWLWVIDFPGFEYNADEKRWDCLHHPFTAPFDEDLHLLDTDPAKARSQAYDLVCNGSELGGGSIRIHAPETQQRVFKLLGIDEAAQKQKFGFLLDALQYGAPPHGGLALGLDRVIMHLVGTTNIRDVIAFPKTQNGADLMLDAPGPVDERQMKELHIRTYIPPAPPAAPATPGAAAAPKK